MREDKKQIILDSFISTISGLILRGIQIVQGLIVANLLSPFYFGFKNALQMLFDYGKHLDIGVLEQFFNESSKDKSRFLELSNIVFSFILVISLVLISLCFIFVYLMDYSFEVKLSILLVSLLISSYLFSTYYRQILRSKTNYKIVSKGNIYRGFIGFILIVSLVYFLGFIGYFLGALLTEILVLFYYFLNVNLEIKFNFDLKLFIILIKSGFYLMIIGLGYISLMSIDRIFIFLFYGGESLGYYAIGLFFSSLVLFLLWLVYDPFMPRILYNINNKFVGKYIFSPTQFIQTIMYFLSFQAIFLSSFLIFLLPEYGPGLVYVGLLMLSTIFMPILSITYFVGKGKSKVVVLFLFFSLLLAVFMDTVVIYLELEMIYFALFSFIALFVYGNSLNFYAYYDLKQDLGHSILNLIKSLIPFFYASIGFCLLWLLAHLCLYSILDYYIVKILQAILFSIWYLPMLIYIEIKHRLLNMFSIHFKNKKRLR